MPRNDVTGEYTLPPVWFQDMASAINKCVAVDGKSTITADIPLGNHKITGLANGTADSDAATIAQVRNGSMLWGGSAGGAANALTVTLTPALAGYSIGQTIRFLTGTTNTGPATLSVDALPAKPIVRGDGSALTAGDLPGGVLVTVVYDGGAFRLTGWLSADLAAIDGLTGTGLIERTADGTAAVVPVSAAGKALLDDIDTAAQRTTLGLGTAATADAANLRDRGTHTGTQAVSTITGLHAVATSGDYADLSGRPTLGTAAALNAGTGAGQVLLLAEANKLPALDGSQLTGLAGGGGGSGLFTSTLDKSANHTAIGADADKLINCTTGLTLGLTAAATLGSGWTIGVKNSSSSGVVLINPDGTETVNGLGAWRLTAGQSCLVTCTGTAFLTVSGGSSFSSLPETNLEFLLRANSPDSFPSVDAQTWKNVWTAPASGALQTAYDVYRGDSSSPSTNDPTFNGVFGAEDESNFFSFDGDDFFRSLTMTTFMRGLHKSGSAFTFGFLLRTPPSFSGNSRILSVAAINAGNYMGMEFNINPSGQIYFQSLRDDGTLALNKASTALAASTLYAIVWSLKQGAGSYVRANKAYLPCDGADTWDGTYSTPSNTDPALSAFRIGSADNNVACLPNGTRLYSIAAYNAWVPEATADIIADGMLIDAGTPV